MTNPNFIRAAIVTATTICLLSTVNTQFATAHEGPAPTQNKLISTATTSLTTTRVPSSTAKRLKKFWKEYRVAKSTQTKLLKKLTKGKKWDALKKNAKVKSRKRWTTTSHRYTKWVYADGSIRALRTDRASKRDLRITSEGTSSCETSYQGTYGISGKDCRAHFSGGLYSVTFDFDYAAGPNGYRLISEAKSIRGHAVGGEITNFHQRRINDWDVRVFATVKTEVGPAKWSFTVVAGARVIGSGYWEGYTKE